jgi:tripartite-type tricarboxylate transporter receptor subunit TctC
MKFPRRQFLHLAAGAAALFVISAVLIAPSSYNARSQTTRTLRIVVPFAPGGGTDILARLLAEQIGRSQATTIVVENRPGGGTVIATEVVSRAAPDGNTVLIVGNSFVVNPHVRKLTYDPLTSFEPVCYVTNFPSVVVVNNASPYRTLADLLSAAHAKPGDLTMASGGPLTAQHMAIEALKHAANVNMTYVPFAGTAPVISALLGEHVTSALLDYPGVVEQLRAGKLRALAITSRMRIEQLMEVPTVAESGWKDYEANTWFGVVAPAKTPKQTLSQLGGWFTSALQAPELSQKLIAQGSFPVGICGADFGAHLRNQFEEYGRIIREANIKGECGGPFREHRKSV